MFLYHTYRTDMIIFWVRIFTQPKLKRHHQNWGERHNLYTVLFWFMYLVSVMFMSKSVLFCSYTFHMTNAKIQTQTASNIGNRGSGMELQKFLSLIYLSWYGKRYMFERMWENLLSIQCWVKNRNHYIYINLNVRGKQDFRKFHNNHKSMRQIGQT